MKVNELFEVMKVKHVDMPIGAELKRALAGNGVKVKSMDGEGNNLSGNLTVTMSNDDVIKFKYEYSRDASNVSAKINGKTINLDDDPHEALDQLKGEYKKHLTSNKVKP